MLLQYQDLAPDQKELLNVMEISSENLLSLINDVLDFSKLEEGKIIFAERNVNVLHFLKNIKMANQVKAEEKRNRIKITYDDDIPEFLVCDDVRLGQILNNLISNAVKFTKDGTITIRVELVANNKQDVDLLFSIEDTGIGIPKEKQNLIFERFTQANNNITREFGGSGLGLTIIRRLLQLQGSEIFLESEPGVGSKFYFTLKFKKSTTEIREESKNSGTDNKPDLTGKKILLVEDVEFNVMVAQRMLKNWNAEVDLAENGAIAVEKVKNGKYDLILMDIQMPVMDGLEATRIIRDELRLNTPIIALTANAFKHNVDNYLDTGMNDYIVKPYLEKEFFQKLNQYIPDLPVMPVVPPELPLYDIVHLREICKNDDGFMHTMMRIFINVVSDSVSQFEELKASSDFIGIRKLAHKLKPGIDNLTIVRIYDKIRILEKADPEQPEPGKIYALIDEVVEVLQEVSGQLKVYLERNS